VRVIPIYSRLRSLRHPHLGISAIALCLLVELAVVLVGIDDLDEGYFAQQGVRVLHGQVPYRDFESLYTPGLAYLHAGLFSVFGGPYLIGPRALSLVLRAALCALLYVLARPVVARPILAALPSVFLLVGFDASPDRWEPHPGWPSTCFAVLAVWCATHPPTRAWLVASGVAAGAAFAFKQNAGAFIFLALLLHGLPRVERVLLPGLGFAAITLIWLVPLILAIDGQLQLLLPFVGAVNQAGLFSPPEPTIIIPLLCLVAGLALVRRGAEPRVRWYLLAGLCLLGTQYPRGDTIHLAWSAPLLLIVGAAALRRVRPGVAGVVVLWAMFLCLPVLSYRIDQVRTSTTPIAGIPYANGLRVPAVTWSDLLNTIAEIKHRTAPGEPILVYPSSPLLYVLADRPNATRFDHLYPGAASREQIQQLLAGLQAPGVRVAVVGEFWRQVWGPPGDNAPLEEWLFANFREVSRFGPYRVFVRSDAGL
jgi:hypothetical protein